MQSPFGDLQIDTSLVAEFFGVFARFEYAMKASQYFKADRWGNAAPDWLVLKANLGPALTESMLAEPNDLIAYLLREPPLVQKYSDHGPVFREVELDGQDDGARALEAAKRVRNNLFHGGKHTPHSPPERDTKLIKAALLVLDRCLEADANLASEFEAQIV